MLNYTQEEIGGPASERRNMSSIITTGGKTVVASGVVTSFEGEPISIKVNLDGNEPYIVMFEFKILEFRSVRVKA